MAQDIYGSNQNSNPLVDALLAALTPRQPPQTPAGDIRPLNIRPPMQSLQGGMVTGTPVDQSMGPDVPLPVSPNISYNPPPQGQAPQLNDNGQTQLGHLLSRLGIPLATAALGVAAPQTLAGATGFQTGYVGEVGRKDLQSAADKKEREKQAVEERKLKLLEEKEINKEEQNRQIAETLKGLLGTGNQAPIGTTMRAGGLTIPLNRKLEEAERATIADAPRVIESIDSIIGLIDSGVAKSNIKKALIDTGNPLFVSGKEESLQSALNDLKSTVPFMRGGKSLTDNEKQSQYALLNTFGKDDKTIKRDLTRFKINMQRLDDLVKYGEQSNLDPKLFNTLKGEILKGSPTVVPGEVDSNGSVNIGRFVVEVE